MKSDNDENRKDRNKKKHKANTDRTEEAGKSRDCADMEAWWL